jgi:hypothetical protein
VFFGGCGACGGADQRQWPGRQSQTGPLCLVWPGAQTAPGCAGLAQCPSTHIHEPERTTYCPPIQTWNLLGGAGRVTITTGGGGGAQPISTSATSTGTESLETTMQPARRTAAQRQVTSKRYFRPLIIHCSLLARQTVGGLAKPSSTVACDSARATYDLPFIHLRQAARER